MPIGRRAVPLRRRAVRVACAALFGIVVGGPAQAETVARPAEAARPAAGSVQAPPRLVGRPAERVLTMHPAPLAYGAGGPMHVAPTGAATLARAPDAWRRRGPIEIRDEWLLAQPRLSLPATSPDPLCRGEWRVRLAANRGSDFGWRQTREGELPEGGDRRFLVDGEHQTVDLGVRYGVSSTLDLGLRVPVQWRGAGFMDGIIDWFHEAIGALDNIRAAFLNDRFRVEGRDPEFRPFSWNDEQGWGLGNVELAAQWAWLPPRADARWNAALVGRVTLPSGTGPYRVGGVDLGLQAVAAARLAPRLDAYLGVGGTWYGEDEIDGVRYQRVRGSGFVALEYQVARTWSALFQLETSSKLTSNVALYPDIQLYVNLGAKIDLSSTWLLEVGFTENLVDQQSTIDFGAFLGLVGRL